MRRTTTSADGTGSAATPRWRRSLGDFREPAQQQIAVIADHITPFVFHRDGKQIKAYDGAWKTACRRAKVPTAIVHDFRRTAVRNLVRADVPEAVAMKLTGHKTRSVFERYNIVSGDDLREAALKLNVALKNGQVSKQALRRIECTQNDRVRL